MVTMRKTRIVGKMVILVIGWAVFLTPIRMIGGILTGIATGINWVRRDWNDLFVAYYMGMADASKKEN